MPRLADDVESPCGEVEGRGERAQHALADGDRVLLVADVLAEDRELVAAEAGDGLVPAQRVAQAIGDGLDQLVAGRVAEAVVDDLEAVEVEEEDGDVAAAAALEALERLAQAVVEQQAARQPGERVAQQLVLVRAPGDDVGGAGGEHEAAVDERPAPRVGDGVAVAVDRRGRDQAAEPVVDDDVADRHQERDPVLVERQDADHHEEVEVRLDVAVREVHEHRRGGDEAERGGDDAQLHARPLRAGQQRRQDEQASSRTSCAGPTGPGRARTSSGRRRGTTSGRRSSGGGGARCAPAAAGPAASSARSPGSARAGARREARRADPRVRRRARSCRYPRDSRPEELHGLVIGSRLHRPCMALRSCRRSGCGPRGSCGRPRRSTRASARAPRCGRR